MLTRMFEGLTTYNPWFGCLHHCYRDGCWANKRLAHRLGKMLKCSLCYSFTPHLHPERLKRVPSQPRIFVGAHCDLFGRWVPSDVIQRILDVCNHTPKETWFFESKNPERYLEFADAFPRNTVLSATIETNRTYPTETRGKTPTPIERLKALTLAKNQTRFPVHVSIEPILDFDHDVLCKWMRRLQPYKVAVGYDSLNNNLPSPPKWKTKKLIEELETFTNVERKQL